MPERIPQSIAIRVPLQAYLTGTTTAATGKTIAVTISKNGAAYGNPAAGATNATEIASGSYYIDLGTGDTGTVGPLFVKGSVATIDDVILIYNVVADSVTLAAIKTKVDFLPAVTAGAAGGLFIAGTNAATTVTTALTTTFTGNLTGSVASVTGAVGSVTGAVGSVTGAVGSVTGAVGSVTGNVGGNVTGSVGSLTTNNDKTGYALTSGERNSVADAVLDRDMSTGADSGSPTVRTVRQALRFLRNKWAIATGTLTVYKEDDSTSSWTAAVTGTAGADPVTSTDPAGP